LGGFGFFDGDLSVFEGYGVNLVALLFCPVGNCGGVWSAAENDYCFLCLFHSFSSFGNHFWNIPVFFSTLKIGHPIRTLAIVFPMATYSMVGSRGAPNTYDSIQPTVIARTAEYAMHVPITV